MGMRIRLRTPSSKPLSAATMAGFFVAALSITVATIAGLVIGWPVFPILLKMGLVASFVASGVTSIFDDRRS